MVKAIVADICATIRAYYRRQGDLEPGELNYLAPAKGQRPAGRRRTIAKTKLVPVRLTIVAQEDIEAVRDIRRPAGRREVRVRRLCCQAFEQGAVPSQRDVAIVTGYSVSAISMTAVALRKRGDSCRCGATSRTWVCSRPTRRPSSASI